jgi:hypothetical protein
MTDSADPRIALMQKWSQENPALVAQAGLMAQAPPSALHESSLESDDFIGSKFSRNPRNKAKKIKDLQKKLSKLHGGGHMPYMPMPQMPPAQYPGYPQVYPGGYPTQWGPVHAGVVAGRRNTRQNTAHATQQANAQKSHDQLSAQLTKKLENYKQVMNDEKAHLMHALEAVDGAVLIKDTALATIRYVIALLDSSTPPSNSGELARWETAVNKVNADLVNFAKHDVSRSVVNHREVKSPDFAHIQSSYVRLWGCGYLIKEIIIIVEKNIQASFKGIPKKDLKLKTYYDHLTKISSILRKARGEAQAALEEMKHAAKVKPAQPERPSSQPTTRTSFSGQLVPVNSEFDSGAGTISMSDPYGL